MGKKKKKIGTVYSTNPNYEYEHEGDAFDETLPIDEQKLLIELDKKARRGKQVTLISGFVGHPDDLKTLAKTLKAKCGVGGSAKDGEIILQGDFRKKVQELLEKDGYRCKVR